MRTRSFVTGLLLGLLLAATPTVANWGFGDMAVLQKISDNVARIAAAQERSAKAQEKIANCCPCPAEKK